MSGGRPLSPQLYCEVFPFVHLVQHARARNEGWESALIMDCWSYPFAEPPDWAGERASVGEPGTRWCPVLDPSLDPDFDHRPQPFGDQAVS